MSLLEAIILGIIQGLTEFLPVSSSGHLEIGKVLLNIETTDNLLFSIILHAATALSTILIFRKDIFTIIRDLFAFKWNESTAFASKIILSMIPVGVIGLLFEDQIEAFFTGNLLLVGGMLIFTALLLSFTYFVKNDQATEVTFPKALLMGIAQAIAIMPGISRSGATIATGLLLKVDREKAARFSFLMVLIPILGATLLKVKDYVEAPSASIGQISSLALVVGFLAAFISGLLACQWMMRIVKQGKLIYFAVYCLIVGAIAIISQLI